MSETRAIVAYVRRNDIAWWAGCRYEPRRPHDSTYIAETPCFTQRGAEWKAKRMARKARQLRDRKKLGTYVVGDPQ